MRSLIIILLIFLCSLSAFARLLKPSDYYEMPTRWWHRLEYMPNPRPPPRQALREFNWVFKVISVIPPDYGVRDRAAEHVAWDVEKAKEILPWVTNPEIASIFLIMLSDYNQEDRELFLSSL